MSLMFIWGHVGIQNRVFSKRYDSINNLTHNEKYSEETIQFIFRTRSSLIQGVRLNYNEKLQETDICVGNLKENNNKLTLYFQIPMFVSTCSWDLLEF